MSLDIVFLRGLVENTIDSYLTSEQLIQTHKFFEDLKPAINNRLDAVFGFVVGQILSDVSGLFSFFLKRQATPKETDEITKAISERLLEIKGRINETNI